MHYTPWKQMYRDGTWIVKLIKVTNITYITNPWLKSRVYWNFTTVRVSFINLEPYKRCYLFLFYIVYNLSFMQVWGGAHIVYICLGNRYVANMVNISVCTWSSIIMAKEHVWTLNCHFAMSEIVWNTTMHLNFVHDEWHGWQLGLVIIYPVYVTNPQVFVAWLHDHKWGMTFTSSTRAMMYYAQ